MAAVFVASGHAISLSVLAAGFAVPDYLRTIEAAHSGVLVFFVLSGYVIGWTNAGNYSSEAAREYVRRRCIRLIPIYFVAMALTFLTIWATGHPEPLRVKLGALLCLQNYNGYFGAPINPPLVNPPIWSLNFEVLYYGLFLLLWRYKPRTAWIFLPAFAFCALGWFSGGAMPLFISSYSAGWVFWAAGWWLASQPVEDPGAKSRAPLLSMLILVFANNQINGVARVLDVLKLYCNDGGMITFADLGSLPSVILVIAAVAHRRLPFRGWIEACAWLVCAVPIAGMIATGRLSEHPFWVTGAYAVVLALLVRGYKSTVWLRPLAWFGGISYAFYVVHFPLLYWAATLPFARTNPLGFAARLVVWAALALSLSWLLERVFQPWAKGRFYRGAKI